MIVRLTYQSKMKSFLDRGYFGAEAKGIDFTMKRRTSEKLLEELDKERSRLSKTRVDTSKTLAS